MLPTQYTVVLIEDSDDDLMLFNIALSRAGLDSSFQIVQQLSAADAAIAFLQNLATPPDIVITDLTLPGGNGLDVLRVIQSLRPKPVVGVFTASVSPHQKKAAEELGADFIQEKNFAGKEFSDFILSLGSLVHEKRARDSSR